MHAGQLTAFGHSAGALLFQFCRYWDVEERDVAMEDGRLVATPELMRPLIDENTIGGLTGIKQAVRRAA